MRLPVLQNIPALQPTELSDVTQRAVEDLLREGESQNTLASYRSALRYWAAWYGLRYGAMVQLPVATPCVLQFIVDHAERTTLKGLVSELPAEIDQVLVQGGYKGKLGAMAHNTLVHRIAVLSKAHQLKQLKNPCHDPKVRELLSRTRKAYAKRGALPQKKDALTKDPLQAILATCDDSLRGKRDRALLFFAWASGGRRRSEVAGAEIQFLKRVGPTDFIYTLAYSKTNQSGVDQPENGKPVLGAAGLALHDWLQVSQIIEGAIFRRIRKGGHIGESLSPAAVRTIVKERCALAGIEGDFSAHSLRSGFVTEAGRQNVPLAETMGMTGHHSVSTVLGYFRSESTLTSRAARLYE
ncbi:MAG: tyrosine-type recombinase/integrase [Rhodoferax sp.]|uniref:tyrosine-type recombinase/integrase n=1 Tax=Rhodoferax sp. TaxID=50421 RepID=UPI001826B66A|nr:tyrosine-type recombinase/integrase [Rhodoferax sp.]NMM12816.1 tyrosine-type recombinase/integrase [Rhodoferax sp.]NMM19839.1 tyrosine-type recombinase/integrase [Rhodoferax sp.]